MVLGDGSVALSRGRSRHITCNGPADMGLDETVHTHSSSCTRKSSHEAMTHVSRESEVDLRERQGSLTPPSRGGRNDKPVRALVRRASTLAIMAQQTGGGAFGKHKVLSKQTGFESLDYDDAENNLVRAASLMGDHEREAHHRREVAIVWTLVVLTGFLTGSTAYFTTWLIGLICLHKFNMVQEALDSGSEWASVEGWLWLSAFVVALAVCASLLTRWSPESAGSGIPHVKAFLNGNKIDGALRPRALVAKVLGISFSVAIGMPAGREGPMVQAGAILANVVPMSCSALVKRCLGVDLQNDFDRRNFVSMGAAAGVAAAFHAPIGGILFSLEEVSSFWDPHLTLLTFVMVTCAAATGAFWTGGIHNDFDDFGLVLWGNYERSNFEVWEVLVFVAIAVLCGLMGAVFNETNRRITVVRKRFLSARPNLKILEAVLTIWLLLSCFYALPFAFECRTLGDDNTTAHPFDGHHMDRAHGIYLVRWQCSAPSDGSGSTSDGGRRLSGGGSASAELGPVTFNEMATLLMQPQEAAIIQLFSRDSAGYFTPSTLILFVLVYYCATVFIYGVAVPSGLFVPCMLIGGGLGRLVGELLYSHVSAGVDPGLYALVGAAGFLGGVTRMTMSLACIVLEISNDIDLVLPIMIAVAIAKQVGDMFNPSMYDVHLRLSGMPMLGIEWVLPKVAFGLLNARSVMASKIVCLHEAESPASIRRILQTTTHHGFPLTTKDHSGGTRLFHGLMKRHKLEELLRIEDEMVKRRAELSKQRAAEVKATLGSGDATPLQAPPPSPYGGIPSPTFVTGSPTTAPTTPFTSPTLGSACSADVALFTPPPVQVEDPPKDPPPSPPATQGPYLNTAGNQPRRAHDETPPLFGETIPRRTGETRAQAGLGDERASEAAREAAQMRAIRESEARRQQRATPGSSPSLVRRAMSAMDHGSRDLPADGSSPPNSRSMRPSRESKEGLANAPGMAPATAGGSHHGGRSFRLSRVSREVSNSSSAGLIDLRPHCDRSPYVVNELLPLRRVFRLFTTMGLRHLVVVDAHSCVVGMITRKDFLKTSIQDWQTLASVRREESRRRYMVEGAQELSSLVSLNRQRRKSRGEAESGKLGGKDGGSPDKNADKSPQASSPKRNSGSGTWKYIPSMELNTSREDLRNAVTSATAKSSAALTMAWSSTRAAFQKAGSGAFDSAPSSAPSSPTDRDDGPKLARSSASVPSSQGSNPSQPLARASSSGVF